MLFCGIVLMSSPYTAMTERRRIRHIEEVSTMAKVLTTAEKVYNAANGSVIGSDVIREVFTREKLTPTSTPERIAEVIKTIRADVKEFAEQKRRSPEDIKRILGAVSTMISRARKAAGLVKGRAAGAGRVARESASTDPLDNLSAEESSLAVEFLAIVEARDAAKMRAFSARLITGWAAKK
jgi:hypothetical protein